MKPRLVKSQREMEGRFEDVWVLVDEEDEVETWPDDAELGIVGSPTIRQDGPVRASGAARYTVDVQLPGMLHALVLRAPLARCRVTALDVDAARAIAGVRAAIGPDAPLTIEGESPLTAEPAWAGDPIAVVAADTPEAAVAGIARPRCDLRAAAPLGLEAGLAEQRFTEEPRETVRGEPDAALEGADVRVELTFETPAHVQIAARAPRRSRTLGGRRAHGLGLDPGDVRRPPGARTAVRAGARAGARDRRVHRRRLRREAGRRRRGGARRGAARADRRPVRLVFARHEEQLVGGRRAATRQTVRLGARRDGTLDAIELEAVVDMGVGGRVFPSPSRAR